MTGRIGVNIGARPRNAWWHTRVAGINLKRLLNLGLTCQDGA